MIEFKHPNSEEDEFDVDESDEEFGAVKPCECESKKFGANGFSYADLGYTDSNAKDVQFVKVAPSTTPSPCNCPPVESQYTGRIITLPCETCRNSYLEHLSAEYEHCQKCESTMTR